MDASASFQAGRVAAARRDDVEIRVRAELVSARPENEQRAVGRPSRLEIVPSAVRERTLRACRDVDHVDREALALGVRGVRELRAIGRPRDVAMRDTRLGRQIALVLAVAVDQPDVETLVPAAIAHERELLRVWRPAGPDRSLVRLGQLEDALSVNPGAEDLERPGP